MPIVSLIDIFTIGVTVSIAWPLPDEPLYKIHEELLDKYKLVEQDRLDQIKQELIQEKADKLANITHSTTNNIQSQTKYANKTQINKIFLSPLSWDRNDWSTVIKK